MVISPPENVMDMSGMHRYARKSLKAGYIVASDVLPVGSNAVIRTIQGDVKVDVQKDTIIVMGIRGEVSAISKAQFDKYFDKDSSEYIYPGEYIPTIRSDVDGGTVELIPYAHSCITAGDSMMFAKELINRTKVFTKHDTENYLLGKPGDYIGVLEDDTSEIFIFERDIFNEIFDQV